MYVHIYILICLIVYVNVLAQQLLDTSTQPINSLSANIVVLSKTFKILLTVTEFVREPCMYVCM